MLNIQKELETLIKRFSDLKVESKNLHVKENNLPNEELKYLEEAKELIEENFMKLEKYITNEDNQLENVKQARSDTGTYFPEEDDPDDPYNNQMQMMLQANELIDKIEADLEGLKMLITQYSQPYFGSILLTDKPQKYYIGRKALMDTNTFKIKVSDWRSDIANRYYQNSAPSVESKILEKNIYDIKMGRLIDVYTPKSGNKDADNYLLSQLKGKKASKLTDIINTIQSGQNEIIREEKNKTVLIQGVAGSGKTTILFHKLAYLVFKYPKLFNVNNICLIVPSRLFKNYTQEILVSLGILGVKCKTLFELFKDFLQDDISYVFEKASIEKQNVFGKTEYLELLKSLFLENQKSLLYRMNLNEDLKNEYIYYLEQIDSKSKAFSFIEKIEYAKDNMLNKYEGKKREKVEERLQEALAEILKPFNIYVHILSKFNQNSRFKNFTNKETELVQNKPFIKLFQSYLKESLDLKEKEEDPDLDINQFHTKDYEFKDGYIEKIVKIKSRNYSVKASLEDLVSLSFIKFLIYGQVNWRFDLIAVDEAQVYTKSQIFFLSKFAKQNNFVLAGDINQFIDKYDTFKSWDEIEKILNIQNTEIARHKMLVSYRIPSEIIEFAKRRITTKFEFPKAVISRTDSFEEIKLEKKIIKDTKELFSLVETKALNEIQSEGSNCAVVSKDKEFLSYSIEQISLGKSTLSKYFSVSSQNSYESRIFFLPIEDVKGLEFDKVILIENIKFTDKEIYLGLTRAISKLIYISPQ